MEGMEPNDTRPPTAPLAAPRSAGGILRVNVADRLDEIARAMPQALAIAEPTRRVTGGKRVYRTVTFRELAEDVNRIAQSLVARGLRPGMRLALMVPPSIDFITLVFALVKSGAVQILIDPGMGKRNLVSCLSEAEPEGFVAVPLAQAIRSALWRRFPKATFNVTVGRRIWRGGVTLDELRNISPSRQAGVGAPCDAHATIAASVNTSGDDPAAIIFTSGSTGPAKGVLYRHGNFDQQVAEIQSTYGIGRGEVDLPCFPLFGLFNAAMGVTTVLPRMNFSRPATVDPKKIIEAIEQWKVTQSFASPAVWSRVGPYCQQRGLRLKSVRRVMSAGAPVPARVLSSIRAVIATEGEVHTPYGATEALPVATIAASEVLGETWRLTEQGLGVCVGRRFPGIELRVIRIVDGPIRTINEAESLPTGSIGELIVRGKVVTTEYATRRDTNALAKILDCGDLSPLSFSNWHRMGDCGYLDEQERFWFCGRLSQRVVTRQRTLFTVPIEAQFNRSPTVSRSALVAIGPAGQQQPAIVLELNPGFNARRLGNGDCEALASEFGATVQRTGVRHLLVYPSHLPVDTRHNAKIFREQLAVWATRQLQRQRSPRCIVLRDVS